MMLQRLYQNIKIDENTISETKSVSQKYNIEELLKKRENLLIEKELYSSERDKEVAEIDTILNEWDKLK